MIFYVNGGDFKAWPARKAMCRGVETPGSALVGPFQTQLMW
jgi:hypothetical protein